MIKTRTNSHSATEITGLTYAHTVLVCENRWHRLDAFQEVTFVGVFAQGRVLVLDAHALGYEDECIVY